MIVGRARTRTLDFPDLDCFKASLTDTDYAPLTLITIKTVLNSSLDVSGNDDYTIGRGRVCRQAQRLPCLPIFLGMKLSDARS